MPTGRRGNTPGGSLRIVLGLAANTNSIICDGSREPETANGCPVLHRMRGPSAVRHSCATLNPDQPNARSPERAQRPCVFFLTLTYMDVGKPYEREVGRFLVPSPSGRVQARERKSRFTSKWAGFVNTVYGPPHDRKGDIEDEESSLRLCIRPSGGDCSPGQDEFRACLF